MVGIVSLVAGSSFLANAHAAPSATVTLTLWSGISGPDQTGFIKIVNAFNSSQSAVQINYDQQSYTGYAQKLATALSANKGPNIWTDCAACSVNYENQGQMTDLTSYIKKSKVLNVKNFPKGLWNQGNWKGKFYLIPLDVVPLMLYYNKAELKKAGYSKPVLKPSSAVLKAAKKLTKGSNQYGMVIPTDWPMQFVWPTLLAQFGGNPFNAKTKQATFNSAAGVKALTTLKNLIYKYHTGPDKYAVDQDIKMLANGQAAQIFDGIWEYTNPSLQTLGKNEGVSQVPQFGPKYKVFIGDLYFTTYKNNTPAEEKAAVKFFEYFEKHSIEMAKVGPVPTYKPVFKSKAFKKLPAALAASKELSHGVFSPRYPGYDDHWLYDDALWPVLRGQTTDIKGSLNKAAQEVTAHLQNNGA
jgi:multiple sugar transport system substrate-binding protein